MFQIFDIVRTPNATVTVLEVDERLTPRGLALELHLVAIGQATFAQWLFEDGRVVKVETVGVG